MKKRIITSGLILAAAVALCACGGENTLSVKGDTLRLNVDEKYTIKVEQKKEEPLKWTSGDESVAIVSPDGTVSAVGSGITTVTARGEKNYVHVGIIVEGDSDYVDKDGNVVRVFDGESNITEISVYSIIGQQKGDITVKKGSTLKLGVITVPSDSKDEIAWESSDTSIARISEDGTLEAVGTGKAIVKAYAPNGIYGEMIVRSR